MNWTLVSGDVTVSIVPETLFLVKLIHSRVRNKTTKAGYARLVSRSQRREYKQKLKGREANFMTEDVNDPRGCEHYLGMEIFVSLVREASS